MRLKIFDIMKRYSYILIVLLAMLCCFSAYGQQQAEKKVAVLLPIDRQGNVNYFLKAMVKGKLTNAVTSMPGYGVYERTDIDAIFEEQAFQRTGYVSDEQMQKMGEIKGVAYVLVSEVAQSGKDVYIQAKLMQVETAKVEKSSDQLCSENPEQMEKGCLELVRKLFGKGGSTYGNNDGTGYGERSSASTSEQSDNSVYYLVADYETIRSKRLHIPPLDAAVNLRDYTRVEDMSYFEVIETRARSLRILSNHPTGSYRFDTSNPNNIKIIIDPKSFWSTSRVCLIATNYRH